MEDWKYMKKFALDLIDFSSKIRDEKDITKQRVIILLLAQSTEIIMKSFLIKSGTMGSKQKRGFYWCLSKINGLEEDDKISIENFHELRNEIQHKALNLQQINKPKEIINFYSSFKKLFKIMFPNEEAPELFK